MVVASVVVVDVGVVVVGIHSIIHSFFIGHPSLINHSRFCCYLTGSRLRSRGPGTLAASTTGTITILTIITTIITIITS